MRNLQVQRSVPCYRCTGRINVPVLQGAPYIAEYLEEIYGRNGFATILDEGREHEPLSNHRKLIRKQFRGIR